MCLLEAFRQHLGTLRLDGTKALVAVSGGPDSVVLLDLLMRSRDVHRLALVVAHLDHGIHPDSGRLAREVQALAEQLGAPCEIGQLRLGPATNETMARAKRYAWLEATRRRVGADFVFTGHQADDQSETVLMRVLRGSGPAGLAGMAARRGVLVRPLLPFRRAEVVGYARAAGLSVWSDPANADPRHLRSWLRTELLPMIRAGVLDVDANLGRLASQAARDRAAWDAVLDRLPELAFRSEDGGVSMATAPLVAGLSSLTQALLVAAARRAGCQLGPARLGRVLDLLHAGTSGSVVPLGGTWRAELSFGRLHIVPHDVPPDEPSWCLEGEEGDQQWGRWRFRWRRDSAPLRQERDANTAWFAPGVLVVRHWRSGERVRPLSGAGRRPVAQCLQEGRVPRWRRAAWPVVAMREDQAHIVWVPGVCRSDALLPAPAADALRIDVEYV